MPMPKLMNLIKIFDFTKLYLNIKINYKNKL